MFFLFKQKINGEELGLCSVLYSATKAREQSLIMSNFDNDRIGTGLLRRSVPHWEPLHAQLRKKVYFRCQRKLPSFAFVEHSRPAKPVRLCNPRKINQSVDWLWSLVNVLALTYAQLYGFPTVSCADNSAVCCRRVTSQIKIKVRIPQFSIIRSSHCHALTNRLDARGCQICITKPAQVTFKPQTWQHRVYFLS